jgi:hypothetical protein
MIHPGYSKKRIKEIQESCACRDCGKHGGLYMLKTKIWLKIWPTYHEDMEKIKDEALRPGMLCLRCAQARLGRKLEPGDFMPGVPCNDIVFYFMNELKQHRLWYEVQRERELLDDTTP